MAVYFDTRTGALVSDFDGKDQVEHRLSQSYPIVPVTEAAAEIIEAGRSALGIVSNEVGDIGLPGSDFPRPEAVETPEEAKANYEAELARQRARAETPPQDRPVIDPSVPALSEDVKVRADGAAKAEPTGEKVKATTRKR